MTKDELRYIPELYGQIQRDKEQLRYLREKATSVSSVMSGFEKVQTSPGNTSMVFTEAAIDLEREIGEKEVRLFELQTETDCFIRTLTDPLQAKVIKLRYLKCMSWDQIAVLLGYTMRHIHRIESDAVNTL